MVMFDFLCIGFMNEDFLKSNSKLIIHHDHLSVSKAPPSKCMSSFHELSDSSMVVCDYFGICWGITFTS